MIGLKEISVEKDKVTTQVRARNKRKPFGVPTSKLSIGTPIEGYHLRWINDEPGRIAKALEGDYVFAEPSEVGRESREDNKVKELVGVNKDGSPMYAYLMKLPMEFYLEDKALKEEHDDKIEEAIRGGKIEARSGDGRYVPEGGISYKTK